MHAESSNAFAYSIIRVIPNLERGEFINAGVVLFARRHRFLSAKVVLDEDKLKRIAPDFNPQVANDALLAFVRVADGEDGAGPIAALDQSERFGWLVAPSSTVIQTSPTHTGICDDPHRALDELFEDLVA